MNNQTNFTPSASSKLEYSSDGTTWKQIVGLLEVPEIGGTPNQIDTTTLDNTEYESFVYGLMPAPELAYEFNMQDPNAEANIAVAYGLKETGSVYQWKITKSNGIVHAYSSVVKISFNPLPINEINKFTMYHAPILQSDGSTVVTTIPTTSG